MKKIIAANWKSNKTIEEAKQWLNQFSVKRSAFSVQQENLKIIICPSYIHLPLFQEYIAAQKLPIELGAQDVSAFDSGAYTGQVSAVMLAGLVDWVIIGHSERRKYFGETDEILFQKVELSKKAGLKIIFCVPDDVTSIPPNVDIVAYEPIWAIGSGKTDTPENAAEVIAAIKQKFSVAQVLYGGSVKPENIRVFLNKNEIDGVLVGGASLDASAFLSLITNVPKRN